MYVAFLAFLAPLFLTSSATTIPQPRSIDGASQRLPLSSQVVHQFPNPTWVENICVRSGGGLLLTIVTASEVYYVDPRISASKPTSPSAAALLHVFPQSVGILGITEVQPSHFYVIGSNFSLAPLSPGLHTNVIYSIDLSAYQPPSNTGAIVKKVADVPNIVFGNGMATLDVSRSLIVIADSLGGIAWVFNVKTGEYSILLQEPEMAPPAGSTGLALGINGVKVLPKSDDEVWVYFDNTSGHLFCRVPVCLSTLSKTGPVEILANLTSQGLTTDDFALDPEQGVAYLACQQNSVLSIPLGGGKAVNVLGGLNQTVVAGPTSVALARGDDSEGKFYVTTNGGLLAPINGTYKEGGSVLAVDTKGWNY